MADIQSIDQKIIAAINERGEATRALALRMTQSFEALSRDAQAAAERLRQIDLAEQAELVRHKTKMDELRLDRRAAFKDLGSAITAHEAEIVIQAKEIAPPAPIVLAQAAE